MIDYVREKQKKSIDQHEQLKEQIRNKSDEMIEISKLNRQDIERRSKRVTEMFNRLETKINNKFIKFTQKSENNSCQINKMIHLLLQQATSQ